MIIVSLLLIFAAVLTLVFGVADRSAPLLIVSIVGTLMAVIVLIASARRTAAARLAAGADGRGGDGREGDGSERAGTARPGGPGRSMSSCSATRRSTCSSPGCTSCCR